MPQRTRATCSNCGRHRDEVGLLSWGGYCGDCGKALLLDNIEGMRYKRGAAWARQQLGTVLAVVRDPRIVGALMDAGVFAYDAPLDAPLDDEPREEQTSAHG